MTQDKRYDFDTFPDRTGAGSLKWDKYKGRDILPMWVADMDFRSAPEIVEALVARAQSGSFPYTVPYDSVCEAVLEYTANRHGYAIKVSWLNWLPGMVPALNLLCRAFCQADESVMTMTPVYPPFLTAPEYAGRDLIRVPLRLVEDKWTFDFDAMETAVRPDTRLLILCSPHNPVGRVYSRTELEALVDFCERHDLILISDEIHCDLILDPEVRHIMTATLSERAAARTVTLLSPSKTYNLPGLACAFSIIEDPRLRFRFQHTLRGILTEVNAFGYAGCEAAYRHGEPWRRELLAYLRDNYKVLRAFVAESLPGVKLRPMEATYLAWLDVSELGLDQAVTHFEQHGVGLSDGTPFGANGHLRLNFGCPRSRLEAALDRMAKAVAAV